MLQVKTKVLPSKIEGMGLFADQFIPAGTVIWDFDPEFDKRVPANKVGTLSLLIQEFIRTYAYREDDDYVICGDNARFMNHSPEANTLDRDDTRTIAARDINIGEELTSDYSTFDDDSKSKPSNELY